jgi:hypothetical protein
MKKRIRIRVGTACVAGSLVLLATGSPPAAAKKPINGKLSKAGYTVIALAANGKANAVTAKPKFKVRPKAKRVTLHLRAKDGTYAGPIVVGTKKKGKRAILGVKAGAKLGKVKVKVRKGYAKPKRRLARRFVDTKRKARAKKGVPIGAGNFGRVRSKKLGGGAPGDRDLDGIADPLDIDDDGDLVLDNFDGTSTARISQTPNEFDIGTVLGLPIYDTANANTPGADDARIEETLPRLGVLGVEVLPGDLAELDCGGSNQIPPREEGLVYCSSGGSGRLAENFNPPTGPPFPGDPGGPLDPDGDGFGTLEPGRGSILHGSNTADIKTGDVLIQRVTTGGAESQFAATLQYVFATSPALMSYSDTAGNSQTVPYPIAGYQPGPPGPGTNDNPFPVAAGSDGDVVLTVPLWRPQRARISGDPAPGPGESGKWTDIGGLRHTVRLSGVGLACPPDTLSESDPSLTTSPPSPFISGGAFTDSERPQGQPLDRPANPANTFTYTFNATKCLEALGQSWSIGQLVGFDFFATTNNPTDHTEQGVAFERQS